MDHDRTLEGVDIVGDLEVHSTAGVRHPLLVINADNEVPRKSGTGSVKRRSVLVVASRLAKNGGGLHVTSELVSLASSRGKIESLDPREGEKVLDIHADVSSRVGEGYNHTPKRTALNGRLVGGEVAGELSSSNAIRGEHGRKDLVIADTLVASGSVVGIVEGVTTNDVTVIVGKTGIGDIHTYIDVAV